MTLFERIAAGEIPAQIVWQDDVAFAFRDIHPQAPTHILVCPRRPLPRLSDAGQAEAALLGRLLLAVNAVAAQEGLTDYRVVVNNGAGAGQSVFHLHLHVLGGRPMGWPQG
jgi:histidine triad (HIT) family protein